MVTRAEIVAEARTWIDTPWMHQTCTKGLACDCGGIIKGTLINLGVYTEADWADMPMNYSRWADGKSLRAVCEKYLVPIRQAPAQVGDVLLLATEVFPQHLGFVGNYVHGGLSIIHSANNARPPRVIETRLMYTRAFKFIAAFQVPGVTD